ncbi:MAG: hypothetical protein ACRDN0_33535 [Trebonia sp.]
MPMELLEPLEHADSAGTVRLKELGLTPEDLDYALRGADAEARTWSAAAPPIMPGLARWAKTNELLRLRLLPRGWSQDNPKLMPRTISPDRAHAIVATAGDAATGIPRANPTTRYAKGAETVKAVQVNVQLAFDFAGLFGWPEPSDFAAPDSARPGDAMETWLLLYNVTETEIRAELSLASGISANGFVGAWRERIILPVIDLSDPDSAGSGPGSAGRDQGKTGRGLPGDAGQERVTVTVEQR